jgi:hypothetical protein
VLESSETDLQVKGTGGVETATITATVWDTQGQVVPAGTEVTLTASSGTFSNGLASSTKLTDGNGQVTYAYQSGTTSGTVTFTATETVTGASGSAALLTVAAGPATQILLSYDTAASPTPSPAGVIELPIGAIVSDVYGNTVMDDTQIFFELTAGGTFAAITPSALTTDGQAEATLVYPAANSGSAVTIQASTLGGTVTATLVIAVLP